MSTTLMELYLASDHFRFENGRDCYEREANGRTVWEVRGVKGPLEDGYNCVWVRRREEAIALCVGEASLVCPAGDDEPRDGVWEVMMHPGALACLRTPPPAPPTEGGQGFCAQPPTAMDGPGVAERSAEILEYLVGCGFMAPPSQTGLRSPEHSAANMPTRDKFFDDLVEMAKDRAALRARVQELLESNNRLVLERRGDLRARVREFFTVVGQPIGVRPHTPAHDGLRLGAKLVVEEFFELMRALFPADHVWWKGFERTVIHATQCRDIGVDMVEAADAISDLKYVTEGLAVRLGIDTGPIDKAVHEANLKKHDGPIREDGKRLKPPDWLAPDVRGELLKQGWRG